MLRAIVVAVFVAGLAPTVADAAARPRCGTGARWRDALARPHAALDMHEGGGKTLHSYFGEQAYVTTSEHFALRAGNCAGLDPKGRFQRCDPPDPIAVTRTLATLEAAYAYQVGTAGYVAPAPSFFLNVYVDGTGQGIPATGDNALAFADLDDLGHPYIVIAHDVFYGYLTTDPELAYLPDLADVTLAHELFHCMQFAAKTLTDFDSFWYWEATATWIESEIFPNNTSSGGYTAAFLFDPRLALGYFSFESDPAIHELLHPYGAALFPTYLSETFGGPGLIRSTWQEAKPLDSVFDVLTRLLPAHGATLPEVVADFAAHNVGLDYARGDEYRADLQRWLDRGRLEGTPPFPLTVGPPRIVSKGEAPQRYGYNVYALPSLQGEHELVFTGATAGSAQNPSRFGVRLIRTTAAGPTYLPLPLDAAWRGRLPIPATAPGESLAVIVAAVPDGAAYEESFTYTLQLVDRHGGCATVGSPEEGAGGLLLLLVVALALATSSPRRARSGTMRCP